MATAPAFGGRSQHSLRTQPDLPGGLVIGHHDHDRISILTGFRSTRVQPRPALDERRSPWMEYG